MLSAAIGHVPACRGREAGAVMPSPRRSMVSGAVDKRRAFSWNGRQLAFHGRKTNRMAGQEDAESQNFSAQFLAQAKIDEIYLYISIACISPKERASLKNRQRSFAVAETASCGQVDLNTIFPVILRNGTENGNSDFRVPLLGGPPRYLPVACSTRPRGFGGRADRHRRGFGLQ